MPRSARCLPLTAAMILFLIPVISETGSAAEPAATELYPKTTVAYAEITDPAPLLSVILDHPLRKRLETLDQYQQALNQENFRQLKAVTAIVESRLDMDWRDIISALAEGGIHVGLDAESEGVALLVRARDQLTLEMIRDTILGLIRNHAKSEGRKDPIKTAEYRGIRAFQIEQAKLATLGSWLLITNQGDLAKRIADRYLDGGQNTLKHNDQFQAAREHLAGRPSAWAFANVKAIRDAGVARELFNGQTENVLAELLVGGLLTNLQHTPYVSASLDVRTDQVQLNLSSPHDSSWVDPSRHYYFGPDGSGRAPGTTALKDMLLTLETYRDIAGMWLHAGDLFDEGVNDGLAQADTQLSTLFSGKDFGEEVLGSLGPQIQLVIRRQDFDNILPRPAIKLPAFALVLRLKNAAEMRDELRRTFQSLIGFLNFAGAAQGQPQLDFEIEKQANKQLLTSNYVPEADEKESRHARINFNFSPAAAFVDDRLAISSTSPLAREISEQPPGQATENNVNTRLRLDLSTLREVLRDNRSQLIAQNMLEEGNSKQEAAKQIDTMLEIVGWFRHAGLQLNTVDQQLQLDVQVKVADTK